MDSSEKEQGLAEHHADVDHQVVDRPSSAMGHHEGEEEDQPMGWAVWMAIIALLFQYNAYLFTLLMPPAVVSYINADLGPDASYVWITVSWNLVAAVVVTVSGRLADIFGRRWFLITGASIASVAAIIGATGKSIPQMIVSGVLFGLGGGCQEMVFSCIQEIVPNRRRFLILATWELGNLPAMFSALLSYVFIDKLPSGWRTCYYWALAWEVVSVVLLYFFYYPPSFETKHREDMKSKRQLLAELDYVGVVLFTAACVLMLVAINGGGTLNPWKSAAVIVPIVVSVVLFVALGFYEVYTPLKYPILPPRLFRKTREFTAILVVVFVAGMTVYSNYLLWPRISSLLFLAPEDTILRGVYASIANFAVNIAGIYCLLIPFICYERWQLVGMSVLQTACIGALASITIADKAKTIVLFIIAAATATVQNVLVFGMMGLGLDDQADIGVAIGLVSTFRLVGGAVASAIYTAIYTTRYNANITGRLQDLASQAGFTGSFAALLKASATNTQAAYKAVAGTTPQVISAAQLAVKLTYLDSFHLVFLISIAFGGVAIIAGLATKSVEGKKKSKSRAVTMENEIGVLGTAQLSAK